MAHPNGNGNGVKITDERVAKMTYMDPPIVIKRDLPSTPAMREQVRGYRTTIANIMHGRDPRLLLIAGPCSIFNERGTVEFARAFKRLADQVSETMLLVMRCPPDKPRTVSKAGQWEGLLHEPLVVGQHDAVTGIKTARRILLEVAKLGVPVAIELLDNRRPQFFDDILVQSWTGARTNQNGGLRRQNSGLSWPVAIKNGTTGDLKSALDAIESANNPNYFDGMDEHGSTVVVDGLGNPDACLILRGGERASARNFDRDSVNEAHDRLRNRGLLDYVLIDSAHGNSLDDSGKKDHNRQLEVLASTIDQRLRGDRRIGAMIEAYLQAGRQDVRPGTELDSLHYDVSPTDPTISLGQFETAVLEAHAKLKAAAARAA